MAADENPLIDVVPEVNLFYSNTSENYELLLLTTAVSQTGECLNSAIVVGSLSLEIAEKALNTSSEIQSNKFTCRTL